MYDFLISPDVYNFIRGPMVWISFAIFVGGSFFRIILTVYQSRNANVIYPYMSFKYSLRSILHWIVPFASTNMRKHPWITLVAFLFHICLIFTPIFLLSHNLFWRESWNIRWWTLPEQVADVMTLIVIFCAFFFLLRRIVSSHVRFVTVASDYILLAIAVVPFITGFLAYHQLFFDYDLMVTFHILSGQIMLVTIPFTRLSHMLFFWLTRAHTGSDFGAIRRSRDY